MSSSGFSRSSRSSIDENTPENNQDSITIEEDRFISKECIHELVCKAASNEELEDVLEEQSLTEESLGNFAKPIYQGVGFHRASNFQDSECGEPARAQYLRLDFSPIEGVDDNEFIVNKCRDFWALVEKNPRLKRLQALPEPHEKTIKKTKTAKSRGEPTAMDWLQHGEGMMSEAFATEQTKLCEGGSGDNCPNWRSRKHGKKNHASLSKIAPKLSVSRRKHLELSRISNLTSSEDVTLLCKQMEAWDLAHPKSTEAPGHPPNLSHALMQRQDLCDL